MNEWMHSLVKRDAVSARVSEVNSLLGGNSRVNGGAKKIQSSINLIRLGIFFYLFGLDLSIHLDRSRLVTRLVEGTGVGFDHDDELNVPA